MKVYDEFTKLRKVVLGDINFNLLQYVDTKYRNYVTTIFEETAEDLNDIEHVYQNLGIEVYRPKIKQCLSNNVITPYYSTNGVRNPLSPRDSFIMIGDTLLETASHKKESVFEHLYYKELFLNLYDEFNINWQKMPMPTLNENCFDEEQFLTNKEPILDAAQITRCGKHLFVSSQGAGNARGLEWIKRHFPSYNVVDFGKTITGHTDGQVKIIKPGLLMSPYSKPKLPSEFKNWTVIQITNKLLNTELVEELFQDDDASNTYPDAGIISTDIDTMVVYEQYKNTAPNFLKMLELHGINLVFVPFRHRHWFSQSITCLTMELERDGEFVDYFN